MIPCRSKLLKTIQQLSFAVHETVLFLDTHPSCKAAVSYYEKQNSALKEAVALYEANYAPLTENSVTGDEWTWAEGPWPWQYEANIPLGKEDAPNVALR